MSAFADHVQLPFKSRLIDTCGAPEEHLLHQRFARFSRIAEGRIVRGDIPPAQHFLSFFGGDFGKNALSVFPFNLISRRVNRTNPVLASFWKFNVFGCGCFLEKLVGYLHQNARAVSGIGFAATSAPMVEV